MEVKWSEVPDESRALANVAKIAGWLGRRAANEHWLVCRTPREYTIEKPVRARVVNAYDFDDWLGA
jgi:hypothetical protein